MNGRARAQGAGAGRGGRAPARGSKAFFRQCVAVRGARRACGQCSSYKVKVRVELNFEVSGRCTFVFVCFGSRL